MKFRKLIGEAIVISATAYVTLKVWEFLSAVKVLVLDHETRLNKLEEKESEETK